MKALGVGLGEVVLRDIEVVRAESGAPSLRAARHGRRRWRPSGACARWLLTISHTDHLAQAVVVALG